MANAELPRHSVATNKRVEKWRNEAHWLVSDNEVIDVFILFSPFQQAVNFGRHLNKAERRVGFCG
jgi:hypothetical protein